MKRAFRLKKTVMFILCVIMGVSSLAGCVAKPEPKPFDPNNDLDTERVFFDDFDKGINPENWHVMSSKWGDGNGGVIPENVAYTADGEVVIFANGDNYAGEKRGLDGSGGKKEHGRQTGGVISTRDALGPGRYEVRMKCVPRFGSGTAVWTFYYKDGQNHEIDIEMNTNNDFTMLWNTNWVSIPETIHYEAKTPVVNNDGEYHTYKFEWHTNPERIDYYVDDIHTYTSISYVPFLAGGFNIGNWFPQWAGQADFETDFMLVDWFRYTPYKNNPYTETPSATASSPEFYPSAPIALPVSNLFSAGNFELENVQKSWGLVQSNTDVVLGNTTGVNGSKALSVKNGATAEQWISGAHKDFTYRLTGMAKAVGSGGGIRIDTIKDYNTVVETFNYDFTDPEFTNKDVEFTLTKDAWRMTVTLYSNDGGEVTFDNLFMNLSKLYKK